MSEKYYVMGFIKQELLSEIESKQNNNMHNFNLILTDNVQRQLIQLLQAKIPLKLAIAPIVVWDQDSKQVEMIFISKKHSESVWEQTLNTHISDIISIQIGLLLDSENGPTCIERLIQKCMNCKFKSEGEAYQSDGTNVIENHFMDAYRMISGGFMHHMDNREWKMTNSNLKSLAKIQCILENKIERLKTSRMDIVRHIGILNVAVGFIKMKLYSTDGEQFQDICNTSWYELEAILNNREAELKVYEDKEIEVMTELENLYVKFQQIKTVLQRQAEIVNKCGEEGCLTDTRHIEKRKSDEIASH